MATTTSFHHQHDDVPDLRQQVGTDGLGRLWPLPRLPGPFPVR